MLARYPIYRQISITESNHELIRTKLFQRLQDMINLILVCNKFTSNNAQKIFPFIWSNDLSSFGFLYTR